MTEPRMTGTKICTKCKRDLPVICFAVCKKHSDGLHSECRECNSKYESSRRPRKDNRKGRYTPLITMIEKGWIS